MSDSIRVENVSKEYRLGKANQETMLRERLSGLLNPFAKDTRVEEILLALKDVSFSTKEGEVVGIIGRNGAGKSTLLKILSKITYPTSGSVKVAGRVASLLEVGTGFHEELTGRENIYLNGSILGMKKREVESKLDAIVSFAGVERFIDTPIKRYSSGMRLRLGFAVAAHLEPDVLIIDEVLAVGDAGTRAIWIDEGQIRDDGETRTIIQAYMSTFAEAHQADKDLSRIEMRRGSGEIKYTGIEFLSPDGQPQPVTRSGDALTLRFHYHASEAIPTASFGFRLTTDMGTLLTDTSTWHHGIDISEVMPGDGYLDLEIHALNLLPSIYHLSLWITAADGKVYDGIEHCARLEVGASNIYRSSRTIDSRYGIVYFPQRWKLDGLRKVRKD